MAEISREDVRLGGILWNYLRVDDEPEKSDLILVLGSPDVAVARHAAGLMRNGLAGYLVVSGGCPISTADPRLEADAFAEVIERAGVDPDRVIRERNAKHTTHHFWLTENLLTTLERETSLDYPRQSVILCCAPMSERRALATGKHRWADGHDFSLGGMPVSYREYLASAEHLEQGRAYVFHRMVGEIERILLYPSMEFMETPEVEPSAEVIAAYARLRQRFYGRPTPVRIPQSKLSRSVQKSSLS